MPYPCSQFCADVKFDIRFDNRFDIKLVDSFHFNHTINFGTKLGSYGIINMEADPKSDIKSVTKSDIRFDIRLWNSFHVKLYHKILIWYQNLWYD